MLLDTGKDATVERVQVLLSATCPKGGALGRYVRGGRLDFLKRWRLGQGTVAQVIHQQLCFKTWDCPAVSSILPGH